MKEHEYPYPAKRRATSPIDVPEGENRKTRKCIMSAVRIRGDESAMRVGDIRFAAITQKSESDGREDVMGRVEADSR